MISSKYLSFFGGDQAGDRALGMTNPDWTSIDALMHNGFTIPPSPFSNWPVFEQRLRRALSDRFDVDAVERVMTKTIEAYTAMRLPGLTSPLEPEQAREVRREIWGKDFETTQSMMLKLLIESYVALETPRGT
jgi:hypothetical protein